MTEKQLKRALDIKKELKSLEEDLYSINGFEERKLHYKMDLKYKNKNHHDVKIVLKTLDNIKAINKIIHAEKELIKEKIEKLNHEFKIL